MNLMAQLVRVSDSALVVPMGLHSFWFIDRRIFPYSKSRSWVKGLRMTFLV